MNLTSTLLCDATGVQPDVVKGKALVVMRGVCDFSQKAVVAQSLGATVLLLASSTTLVGLGDLRCTQTVFGSGLTLAVVACSSFSFSFCCYHSMLALAYPTMLIPGTVPLLCTFHSRDSRAHSLLLTLFVMLYASFLECFSTSLDVLTVLCKVLETTVSLTKPPQGINKVNSALFKPWKRISTTSAGKSRRKHQSCCLIEQFFSFLPQKAAVMVNSGFSCV